MDRSIARLNILLLGAGILALVLGRSGFEQILTVPGKPLPATSELLYRSAQLFTFNLSEPGVLPLQLEVAKWLAPLVTLLALLQLFWALLKGHFNLWHLRGRDGHLVVAGSGWINVGAPPPLSLVLAQLGTPCFPSKVAVGVERVMGSDTRSLVVDAAMAKAARVVIRSNSELEMLDWLAALRLACASRLVPLDVSLVLPYSRHGFEQLEAEPVGNLRVTLVVESEIVLQRCMEWLADALARSGLGRRGIALHLYGSSVGCMALMQRLLEVWIPLCELRLRVTLTCVEDEETAEVFRALEETVPYLELHRMDAAHIPRVDDSLLPVFFGFVGAEGSIFSGLENLRVAADAVQGEGLLVLENADAGEEATVGMLQSMVPSGITVLSPRASDYVAGVVTSDELQESLARLAHARYLQTARPGSTPATRPWEELPARYRNATRRQVQTQAFKLAALGFTLEQAESAPEKVERAVALCLEDAARAEHCRWMTGKRMSGWSYAPVRNDSLRHHPCLIDYSDLPEDEKAKDRAAWESAFLIPGYPREAASRVL